MKTFEVEQKFRISHPAVIRAKIKKLGGKLISNGQEKNELWDYKNLVRGKSSVLRLRETGKKAWLTFKGPRLKSKYKKRLEIETSVDAGKVRAIFRALGFHIVARYQKKREEYALKNAHITLDYLNVFGWFVEIEAPHQKIGIYSKQLGFSAKDREERSYLEMVYGNRSLWAGK